MEFTKKDYDQAMEVFTIEQVKRHLKLSEEELSRLESYRPAKDIVINNQAGTTIIKGDATLTVKRNIETLKESVKFYKNILKYHSVFSLVNS